MTQDERRPSQALKYTFHVSGQNYMIKKRSTCVYLGCLLVGALIGYFAIELKPVDTDIPKVDVKIEVPEPVVIRDTITNTIMNTAVKYKYIYKDKCCYDYCVKDTIK